MSDRVYRSLHRDIEIVTMKDGKYSAIIQHVHLLLGHGRQGG